VAVRIDFFSLVGAADVEMVTPEAFGAAVAAFDAGTAPGDAAGPVRCVGWLSAGDDDEEAFTDWCDEVDDELGIGLLRQGVGDATHLDPAAVEAGEGELAEAWTATLRAAVSATATDDGRLGWRTSFDVAGTAGTTDDYPTATHPIT
jgi:hypothetical protein